MPRVQAGGVVIRSVGASARFLLVTAKREPERWVLPKGGIDKGESAEAAALREVREEAGVEARVRLSLGAIRYPIPGDERQIEFFLMDYVKDVTAEDARRVSWFEFDDAVKRVRFEEPREILERARKAIAE